MAKRRTKAQKIKATGFRVNLADLPAKSLTRKEAALKTEASYLRLDLTKVGALTMLALALEIVFWLKLKH